MAKFDIFTAAANAYKASWTSRRYLARLAAVPLALKLICFALAGVYAGGSDTAGANYLLFMLILVPALLAQGWMLAHWVRFLVLGQTWPFRPSGDLDADKALLATRARGVLSGMVVFVLINMTIGLLNDFAARVMMPYMPTDPAATDIDIPPYVAVFSIVMLVLMFWGFRLLWLYVPMALNMPVRDYLARLKGAGSSLYLIGVWVLCFLPFIVMLKYAAQFLGAALPEQAAGAFVTALSVLFDIIKSIVTTAGVAFGLREMFAGKGRVDRRV